MKLNIDCVRDVMLWAEANSDLRHPAIYIDTVLSKSLAEAYEEVPPPIPPPQFELLTRYDNDEIVYHIKYCIRAGLLDEFASPDGYSIGVSDLTPSGHAFLESIRYPVVYEKVKKVLNMLGVKSLEAAMQASSLVISNLIKSAIRLKLFSYTFFDTFRQIIFCRRSVSFFYYVQNQSFKSVVSTQKQIPSEKVSYHQ